MRRRLGNLGIFVEVNDKFYLSEEILKQLGDRQQERRSIVKTRENLVTLRIVRVIMGILFISLVLVNLFVRSLELRLLSSAFLAVLLGISILQLYYLTKSRKNPKENR